MAQGYLIIIVLLIIYFAFCLHQQKNIKEITELLKRGLV